MKSKRKIQYEANKKAKVGEEIICPICGEHFIKKQYTQAFDSVSCKDAYWNGKKDRHRDGNYYYHEYNMKHPERLERVGIYDRGDGKFGHYDEDGEFWTFEQEADFFGMCEDPIMGV